MELNETQKLLHSKQSHKQYEKTTHRSVENICKSCGKQGLVSKIYKQLTTLNSMKKITQSKIRQKMSTDISAKKTYRWPGGMRKDVQHC